MYWIYDIPTWELAILIIAPILLVSSAIIFFGRTSIYGRFRLANDTNDGVNGFISAMGVLYGLLLGLVAVTSWENLDYVDSLASKEATSIAQLYRDVSTLDEPTKTKLHKDLEDYLHYVIDISWPSHKLGQAPNGETAILSHFLARLSIYHTRNVEQQIFLAEVFTTFNRLTEDRRLRMHSVDDTGIGSIVWIVVLAGGALTLAGSFLIHLPTLEGHLLMNGLFSLLLGLMIFMLAAIDQPFRGEMGITPSAYVTILNNLKGLDIDKNSVL